MVENFKQRFRRTPMGMDRLLWLSSLLNVERAAEMKDLKLFKNCILLW